MAYLRIVLLGSYRSGKSSAGNTILGGSGFKVSQRGQRSWQCEVRHGEVAGRRLTVVDSPGWVYNNTPEMEKLVIRNSVCLCPPGPHAALLTVPLHEAFTKRLIVEEQMSLLPQSVWSHTIVLFTYGDRQGDRSIDQLIEAGGEDLRWLLDKCENRFHVFNNEKRDDTQVTQLLEKIEQMVAGNRGGHYEVDGDVAEKLSERKRNIEEHVLTLMTKTHRQTAALKALFEGEHQSLPDVRLMLVGGNHWTRMAAGDLILQGRVLPSRDTEQTESVRQQRRVADRNVSLVSCPSWIKDELLHGVTLCSPGPHAVLLLIQVMIGFSEVDRRSVEEYMALLGDRVWRHTLVLFVDGFWLGGRRVEEYIESEGEALRWIIEKCGYRYQILDFSKALKISELKELMEKVEALVTRNRGHFVPSDSREDGSVKDTGHLREGYETTQKTLFERLKGKKRLTDEEWNGLEEERKKKVDEWRRREEEGKRREEEGRRREEEMVDRMLQFVVKEPEEPTLPAVRRRRQSIDWIPPSLSGGTPSEAGSSYHQSHGAKVFEWQLKRNHAVIAPSSGYGTMSEAPSQPDTDMMNLDTISETSRPTSHKTAFLERGDGQNRGGQARSGGERTNYNTRSATKR